MAAKRDEQPSTSNEEHEEIVPQRIPQVKLLRGMKDVLPDSRPYWLQIRALAEELAQTYGYGHLETPILEQAELFTRSIGASTDIVEKELFDFTDKGGDHVALRPEGTASVIRSYIEHGFANHVQPVKFFYSGPMFRYDRPQAGRYRQFHQFGFEIIGEGHPAADAELLNMGANVFRALAIPVTVQVNSMGCAQCRPGYITELEGYLTANRTQLSEESRDRLARSPLRVLDSKQPEDRQVIESAPQLVDWLCEPCKQHFIRVLEYLDELEVPYALAPFLVRGLEYYTKTVFEFTPTTAVHEDGTTIGQVAVAAGGRYDGLVEALGGQPASAVGIAFGIERIILRMKEAVQAGDLLPPPAYQPSMFLAQLGEQAKRKAMRLFEDLRRDGFAVAAQFSKDSLKAQLELANQLAVTLTLILGQKEVIDGTIIVREMSSGIQEIIAYDKIIPEVRKRLVQETVRESQQEPIVVGTDQGQDQERGAPPIDRKFREIVAEDSSNEELPLDAVEPEPEEEKADAEEEA